MNNDRNSSNFNDLTIDEKISLLTKANEAARRLIELSSKTIKSRELNENRRNQN